eukprot:CAMPEP_0202971202 /NCGR_PEP_ID=MMETSP1396-20130829/24841_1 /ASSEMBLY_ACC=CAM_ASM_000872 /TAXON_ID= /ORGANISM="Pseudokeronopsis sp., Strain Brazil" /LENGTH=61 /DNA_ID=CAMNT_0049700365 /DNA_START=419 /DNA_END=604 /DNA_ORIENTATION=-
MTTMIRNRTTSNSKDSLESNIMRGFYNNSSSSSSKGRLRMLKESKAMDPSPCLKFNKSSSQ